MTQVTGYNSNTERWSVEWLEGTTKEKDTQLLLPRLRVYLKAEDPFNFADRVADAHTRREVRKLYIKTGHRGASHEHVVFIEAGCKYTILSMPDAREGGGGVRNRSSINR